MFAHDLHVALAWAAGLSMLALAGEAGVRAARGRGPGRAAGASLGLTLILLGMSAAAGLAMLVRSERPREVLHLFYAVLAFGLVPVADALAVRASARGRAMARLVGALLALGVIVRLFATG
jgi:hypothetical protein